MHMCQHLSLLFLFAWRKKLRIYFGVVVPNCFCDRNQRNAQNKNLPQAGFLWNDLTINKIPKHDIIILSLRANLSTLSAEHHTLHTLTYVIWVFPFLVVQIAIWLLAWASLHTLTYVIWVFHFLVVLIASWLLAWASRASIWHSKACFSSQYIFLP